MSTEDLFGDIRDDHLIFRDSLKVAQRTVIRNVPWLQRTFTSMTPEEAAAQIASRFADVDDRTILALWTRFERYIIEYVQKAGSTLAQHEPVDLIQALSVQLSDAIERRKFDELLGLFTTVVHSNSLGYARKVKKYRDWIVHQNPAKSSPEKVEPAITRRILSAIIGEIRAADPGSP